MLCQQCVPDAVRARCTGCRKYHTPLAYRTCDLLESGGWDELHSAIPRWCALSDIWNLVQYGDIFRPSLPVGMYVRIYHHKRHPRSGLLVEGHLPREADTLQQEPIAWQGPFTYHLGKSIASLVRPNDVLVQVCHLCNYCCWRYMRSCRSKLTFEAALCSLRFSLSL